MRTLFITRKYPPEKGGMELYSYNLIQNYTYDKKVIKLNKKQINLIWFLPYCLIYIIFNARKFDVLELGDMLLCSIGWIAKRINKNIKVVATVHGLDITYKNRLYQFYLRLFSYSFDMYVPNSSYTRNIAEGKGYYPLQVIFPATLPNKKMKIKCSSREEFCNKYNIPFDNKIMITTGRLIKRKGVEWFISEVFPKIKRKNFCYLIVGEGIRKNEIEEVVRRSEFNNIKLLGKISDNDLWELYENADIFVMPNIIVEGDVEGYGMVAVEAAAARCVVVASDLQGIKDAVVDGENGFLVEACNAEKFAEKITEVLRDLGQLKTFTKKAQEYVFAHCTGQAIAEQYYKLFINLMDSKK